LPGKGIKGVIGDFTAKTPAINWKQTRQKPNQNTAKILEKSEFDSLFML
jgi:hypothetical protein